MCLKIQTLRSKNNCFKRVTFLKKYRFFFYIKAVSQTRLLICLNSGAWCATLRGRSTSPSLPCWWGPASGTWCSGSWPTGKSLLTGLGKCYVLQASGVILTFPPRFGRHPMLIISVLSMLAFGLSVAFSVNVPMFSILRFFEGFSLAGIVLSLYLLSELNSLLKCEIILVLAISGCWCSWEQLGWSSSINIHKCKSYMQDRQLCLLKSASYY